MQQSRAAQGAIRGHRGFELPDPGNDAAEGLLGGGAEVIQQRGELIALEGGLDLPGEQPGQPRHVVAQGAVTVRLEPAHQLPLEPFHMPPRRGDTQPSRGLGNEPGLVPERLHQQLLRLEEGLGQAHQQAVARTHLLIERLLQLVARPLSRQESRPHGRAPRAAQHVHTGDGMQLHVPAGGHAANGVLRAGAIGDDGLGGLGLEVLHRHDEGLKEVRVSRAPHRPALVQVQAQAEASPLLAVRGHRHMEEEALLGHLEKGAHALQRVLEIARVLQLGRSISEGVLARHALGGLVGRGVIHHAQLLEVLAQRVKHGQRGPVLVQVAHVQAEQPHRIPPGEAGLEVKQQPVAAIRQAHHFRAPHGDGQDAQVAAGAEAPRPPMRGGEPKLRPPGEHQRLRHLLRGQRLHQGHRGERLQQEVEEGGKQAQPGRAQVVLRGQAGLHREEGHGLDEAPHMRILPVQRHMGVRLQEALPEAFQRIQLAQVVLVDPVRGVAHRPLPQLHERAADRGQRALEFREARGLQAELALGGHLGHGGGQLRLRLPGHLQGHALHLVLTRRGRQAGLHAREVQLRAGLHAHLGVGGQLRVRGGALGELGLGGERHVLGALQLERGLTGPARSVLRLEGERPGGVHGEVLTGDGDAVLLLDDGARLRRACHRDGDALAVHHHRLRDLGVGILHLYGDAFLLVQFNGADKLAHGFSPPRWGTAGPPPSRWLFFDLDEQRALV
ncbi:hypothetical protein STIAU_3671 [Stigmatella aurantiaca DW4/3-1]|uniref:Uncharacterized protein n=1 Tax=Stigmatella aurantiaca (strain DW4/3-1) TaxID=378806 RepID=Q09CG6_STIAD|nr:hypothetical protein STIAU_3671 [Stigmatella aurantiaca DW4/3-1]